MLKVAVNYLLIRRLFLLELLFLQRLIRQKSGQLIMPLRQLLDPLMESVIVAPEQEFEPGFDILKRVVVMGPGEQFEEDRPSLLRLITNQVFPNIDCVE